MSAPLLPAAERQAITGLNAEQLERFRGRLAETILAGWWEPDDPPDASELIELLEAALEQHILDDVDHEVLGPRLDRDLALVRAALAS